MGYVGHFKWKKNVNTIYNNSALIRVNQARNLLAGCMNISFHVVRVNRMDSGTLKGRKFHSGCGAAPQQQELWAMKPSLDSNLITLTSINGKPYYGKWVNAFMCGCGVRTRRTQEDDTVINTEYFIGWMHLRKLLSASGWLHFTRHLVLPDHQKRHSLSSVPSGTRQWQKGRLWKSVEILWIT